MVEKGRKDLPAALGQTYILRLYTLVVFALITTSISYAQDVDAPRFFKLDLQNLSYPNRTLDRLGIENDRETSELDLFLVSKLRFPILLKGNTKLIGELGINYESVHGLHELVSHETEDFHFYRSSVGILVKHEFNDKLNFQGRYIVYNGTNDFFNLESRAMSYSSSSVIQKDYGNKSIGLGLYVNYNIGLTILPIIKYNKQWTSGWELDVFIPSKITLEKNINESTKIHANIKGSTANYFLSDMPIETFDPVNYRRLTIHPTLGIDRQLSNLIGFSVEAGASVPIRSGLYEDGGRQWQSVHDFDEHILPYFKAGLYMSLGWK